MTTTPIVSGRELVPVAEPLFTDGERAALAGFLAGYSGLTREAYTLDLRQYTSWCAQHGLHLFTAKRADIECFGRDMEANGRARATIAGRLCTVAGFYRYAVEEDLLEHSPAAHVRRPRLDYESHVVGLDRNEVGALLVAAGLGTAAEHALISLLAINGLRISEALGADVDDLGLERGHRTLTVLRKGGKLVTIPRPMHGPGDRSGHQRTSRRADLPASRWAADGSAQRRADRPPGRPTRRAEQEDQSAHVAARVHHRRP
jgi:integrase